MKRIHVHRVLAVALGLVMVGLTGLISAARIQGQEPVMSAPQQWVLLYRLDHDLYAMEDLTPKLLVANIPLSDLAILQMAIPERFQQVPLTSGYEFHIALPSPTGQAFIYLERVDLGQDFNLWLVQDDGQRKLLLSQRYQDGAPSIGYMVPIAWSADNTILLHETLAGKAAALWQLSLSDLSLQRLGDFKEFYSPDALVAASVQPTVSGQKLMLKNSRTLQTQEVTVGAQDERFEIVGWVDINMIPVMVNKLQQRMSGILTAPFLYWPLPGGYRNITCGFGCYSGHGGIDVDTDTYPSLTPIHAAAHGWVEAVEKGKTDGMNRNPSDGYANYIKIRHDNGYYTIYAHMQPNSARVSPGQEVWPGTPLGNASNSGMTCGNDPANSGCYGFRGSFYHLHFEVRSCSTANCAVNPFSPYIFIGNPPSVPGGPSEPTPTPRPNRPPNTPSPQSPGDWYVARDGRAPTLCWNNPGDPDGDSLQFYAEVYQSAVNANSGWQSGTCWRPGNLDGQYYNYQWHVKAKDSRGAESGWSATWHFSIEAPNEPPRITFDTANGNGDSYIRHRDRDWTFRGTASDPEGRLQYVEFRCDDCDNRGSGPDRTGGGNWSLTRTGMAGKNVVYFRAADDRQSTDSRRVTLEIDLAPPTTQAEINGQLPGSWPQWFTQPAQVRLTAQDGNTGRAGVGVREIRYRVDNVDRQPVGGNTAAFNVDGDGAHTVEYYAVDNVGNQETPRSITFRIDRTPPTPPGGVSETHGVVSGQWQKAVNTPTFTWQPSSDDTSGVWGYQFYFGPDPNGVAYQTFTANDPRQWTPLPGGVRTGTYYLRGRARDNAGNWSDWATLFTFRYDGTPPENPREATHAAGITNDTWQRTTNLADFTWPAAHDEGSGIKGYFVYWGTDPEGTEHHLIIE
jgi:murein DD-endopeptidase MepM/ murein hydrolase activator NlpD